MLRDRKLADLKGRKVNIRANGFDYTGTLIEATPEYVLIRRVGGHAQIPMDRVQLIKSADERPPGITTENNWQTPPTQVAAESATPADTAPAQSSDDEPLSLNWPETVSKDSEKNK